LTSARPLPWAKSAGGSPPRRSTACRRSAGRRLMASSRRSDTGSQRALARAVIGLRRRGGFESPASEHPRCCR
jgi:hypothetical protein